MLFIVGLVIAVVAIGVIRRRRVAGAVDAPLGCMSEQWLAEHRASHAE